MTSFAVGFACGLFWGFVIGGVWVGFWTLLIRGLRKLGSSPYDKYGKHKEDHYNVSDVEKLLDEEEARHFANKETKHGPEGDSYLGGRDH